MHNSILGWQQLLALWVVTLAVSGCMRGFSWGPEDSVAVTRVPASNVIGVAFFDSSDSSNMFVFGNEWKPGISVDGQRAIEDRLIAGLREKGYSPINLGTYRGGYSKEDIFARDVTPNRERSTHYQGMERKRREVLARAAGSGAASLLIVSYQAIRTGTDVYINRNTQVIIGVPYRVLDSRVGWTELQGQWLGWFMPLSNMQLRSVDFEELERRTARRSGSTVRVTELKDEVWTAGFSEAVLEQIPQYR